MSWLLTIEITQEEEQKPATEQEIRDLVEQLFDDIGIIVEIHTMREA